MTQTNIISRYDAVIVGSGIAGLMLALELDAEGMRAALICKGRLEDSNTSWAQGGIAITTGENPLDNSWQHLADTISAGAGLCDVQVASGIIEDGRELFTKLERLGCGFDREGSKLSLAREGGHSQSRVLHVKDASGRAISQTLIANIRKSKRIALFEEMFAVDLLSSDGRCTGLRVLKEDALIDILAPRVILASGGLGQVFERTTNPRVATGDGIAMAYRAGATLVDMEFVQFHPTALYLPGAPASLITEAVRGAGAHLLDSSGNRFMFGFHKDGELATRDIVSRGIAAIMKQENQNFVHLDLRPIGAKKILEEFPNIVAACRNWGIDPLERSIPVSPAAHYFMGGIWTDEFGHTSIEGLYAIGECASSGFHGANRLASNSLLEGGVSALRVARAIVAEGKFGPLKAAANVTRIPRISTSSIFVPSRIEEFKHQMSSVAGLIRDEQALVKLLNDINASKPIKPVLRQRTIEAANIGTLGALIAESALLRKESRGAHFRADFPARDDMNFLGRITVSLSGSKFVPMKETIILAQANVVQMQT